MNLRIIAGNPPATDRFSHSVKTPWELSSLYTTALSIYMYIDSIFSLYYLKTLKMTLAFRKENVAHPRGVLSEVRWWYKCGPRLQKEPARAYLSGPDGAGPDAPACPSLQRGSCWGSASAGRGPGGGNGRCPSRCRWCRPGSWSAGLAPWACSCPPPSADLGREKGRSANCLYSKIV